MFEGYHAWSRVPYDLHHTHLAHRYTLHKRAYQHRVGNAVELMVSEALWLADPHVFLPGKDGAMVRMSETTKDMVAYYKLGDYLLKQIANSASNELAPARKMLERIQKRQLYCMVRNGSKPVFLCVTPPPHTHTHTHAPCHVMRPQAEEMLLAKDENSAVNKKRDIETRLPGELVAIIHEGVDGVDKTETDRITASDIICQHFKIEQKNPATSSDLLFYQPNKDSNEAYLPENERDVSKEKLNQGTPGRIVLVESGGDVERSSNTFDVRATLALTCDIPIFRPYCHSGPNM